MATIVEPAPAIPRDHRFFLTMAIVMALVLVAGFSLQLAAGRSSFGAPIHVHVHAFVFFGWTVLYVTQNALAASGSIALHRRLGWLGAGWIGAMVVVGIYVTAAMVRRGGVPFFFTPAYFLVMDCLAVLSFAGLSTAAILLRRRTEWHRRLHYCGMATLTGPGFGRLLPLPFLIPNAGWAVFAAIMIFPAIGILADKRRTGTVHPAWWWGAGTMIVTQLAIVVIGSSALGAALYDWIAAGSPGAAIAPLAYPPSPLP
ncbi:MAG: hypothetical protein ABW023_03460 [Sphingomonas sp.]